MSGFRQSSQGPAVSSNEGQNWFLRKAGAIKAKAKNAILYTCAFALLGVSSIAFTDSTVPKIPSNQDGENKSKTEHVQTNTSYLDFGIHTVVANEVAVSIEQIGGGAPGGLKVEGKISVEKEAPPTSSFVNPYYSGLSSIGKSLAKTSEAEQSLVPSTSHPTQVKDKETTVNQTQNKASASKQTSKKETNSKIQIKKTASKEKTAKHSAPRFVKDGDSYIFDMSHPANQKLASNLGISGFVKLAQESDGNFSGINKEFHELVKKTCEENLKQGHKNQDKWSIKDLKNNGKIIISLNEASQTSKTTDSENEVKAKLAELEGISQDSLSLQKDTLSIKNDTSVAKEGDSVIQVFASQDELNRFCDEKLNQLGVDGQELDGIYFDSTHNKYVIPYSTIDVKFWLEDSNFVKSLKEDCGLIVGGIPQAVKLDSTSGNPDDVLYLNPTNKNEDKSRGLLKNAGQHKH